MEGDNFDGSSPHCDTASPAVAGAGSSSLHSRPHEGLDSPETPSSVAPDGGSAYAMAVSET